MLVTAVSAVLGGIAGYGTGPLMPLVLVPIVGAEPVVPIIAISSMFTNSARVSVFRQVLNVRLAIIAFVAALQHIPAKQRAVLVLRDVLGFSAREVAETLQMTAAAVDTALQRAHNTVDDRLPARSQQATLHAVGDERLRELVEGFVDAWERADVDSIVAMLAHDATITMPPRPTWFRGRDAVDTFLRSVALAPGARWRLRHVSANGQLAFGEYRWNDTTKHFVAEALTVLTLTDTLIADITAFRTPELFAHFGLPELLEP